MRLDPAVKLLVFFGDADVEAVQHAEMSFARLPRHLDDLLHAHSAGFRDGLVLGLAMSIGPTVGEASGPHQLIHTGGSLDPVTAEFRGGHLHDAIRCVLARMRHSVWSAPRQTRTRCMAAGDSPPRAGGIGSALSERPGSIADTSRTAISLPLTSKIGAPEQLKSLSSERHSEAVVPIFIDRGARIKRRHGPERPRYSLPPTRLSASPVQETNGGAVEGADGPHVSWITANSDLSISSRKLPVWCRCTRT